MRFDVKNLSFSYGNNTVLEDVSFSIKSGELISLLGRNGSGKTTLMRLLLGFLEPKAGCIEIDGKSISRLSRKQLANEIAYIPQYSEMAFSTTVIENAVMGRCPKLPFLSSPGKKDYEIVRHYLNELGIKSLENKSMAKISGGERQLALIARALTQEAKILLLDEPTSALDYSNQLMILETADKLRRDGYTILFSTHNPEQALWLSTSVLILDEGKAELYSPSELANSNRLSTLYKRDLMIKEIDTGKGRRFICLPM